MRLVYASALAAAIALTIPVVNAAPQPQDPDRKVAGGGITAPGWMGAVDAGAKGTINDSKFEMMGNDLHGTIGPAAIYWNPKNTASGDYMVSATITDLKPGSAGHPHPAGVFIGGSNLDTPKKTLVYCTVYSNGNVLVRGFSEGTVFTRTPGRAECLVNGTSVAGYNKDEIVGAGKLSSLDGIYGIRVSHNMDVKIAGLAKK